MSVWYIKSTFIHMTLWKPIHSVGGHFFTKKNPSSFWKILLDTPTNYQKLKKRVRKSHSQFVFKIWTTRRLFESSTLLLWSQCTICSFYAFFQIFIAEKWEDNNNNNNRAGWDKDALQTVYQACIYWVTINQSVRLRFVLWLSWYQWNNFLRSWELRY